MATASDEAIKRKRGTGTTKGMATRIGGEVRVYADGTPPYILFGQERDRMHRRCKTRDRADG